MSGSSIPAENHVCRSPISSPASHAASPLINLKVGQILRSPPCCAQLLIMNQSGCPPASRELDGHHLQRLHPYSNHGDDSVIARREVPSLLGPVPRPADQTSWLSWRKGSPTAGSGKFGSRHNAQEPPAGA